MEELPGHIALARGAIHVVHARLESASTHGELLDATERARADAFVVDRVRARFVASHEVLRLVLARFVDCPAASLRFHAQPGRKPRLTWPASDIRFSLSHSGDRALVAVASGADVGVDIEQERDVDALALARRFFTRGEAAAVTRLSPEARRTAFFRIWTRKEAVVKASGDGLRLPLSAFEVGLNDDEARVPCRSLEHPEPRIWRVVPLQTDRGYAAALAADDGEWAMVSWTFADSSRARR